MATLLCDVIIFHHRRLGHKLRQQSMPLAMERVTWFSIAMYACGSVRIVMALWLAALSAARDPLI